MSSIPTVFSYKEPFATLVKSHNKDYAKVDEEIRNEVAGSVLEFLKAWPSTKLIRMNGSTTVVGDTGAMRVAELKVVIDHADTKTHAGGLGGAGSWEWKGHGNCEVTVQSIG